MPATFYIQKIQKYEDSMANTIITSDTTWLAGSQHDLTSNVQIATGVTLTIQPGTIINGNGNEIDVFGTLAAAGNRVNLVRFNNVKIVPQNPTSPFKINLDYVELNGGSFYTPTGNSLNGGFSLTNSYIHDVQYFYVWYPSTNSLIQGNYFSNFSGIETLTSETSQVKIDNNTFANWTGVPYSTPASLIVNDASYATSSTTVSNNNFLGTGIVLELPAGYNKAAIIASGNYFGTSNLSTIQARIFDKNNDLSSGGFVSNTLVASSIVVAAPTESTFVPNTSATDTAENLLAEISNLQSLQSTRKLISVTVTGINNNISSSQAATLGSLTGFNTATGSTLVVSDSASNLLVPTNALGIAKATSVKLTGTTNSATVAQTMALAALPNFNLASGANLTVSDTAATLSSNFDNLQRLAAGGFLTSILATDGKSVLIAARQLTTDSLAVAALTSGYVLSGSAATVQGAAHDIHFDDNNTASVAQSLLIPFNNGLRDGSVFLALAGTPPTVTSGTTGLLELTSGGNYAVAPGYLGLIDTATVPATVFGGSSDGQLIEAGAGGLAFLAGSGAGTVVAGDGKNLISVYPGGGSQNVITGNGDNTVVFLAGNNTINGGRGNNQILAQGGNNLVNSSGTDLINAPSGNTTINSGSNNPTIFLGSGSSQFNGGSGNATVVVGSSAATLNSQGRSQLWMQGGGGVVNSTGASTVIGGTGATTVNAATGNSFVFAGAGQLAFNTGSGASTVLGSSSGSATLRGGTGSLIDIGYGRTNFVGGSGADTIAAFGGSATMVGGSGTGVFLGAPGGHNQITGGSGRVTIFGGGDGDLLTAGSGPGDNIKAGGGAETISALGTSGSETFYGGTGDDLFLLGAGPTQLLVGTGNETIVAGSGTELFAFTSGQVSNVVIQNFVAGKDFISLVGFGTGALAAALGAAAVVSGSERLVLSDGTKILFQNYTGLTSANFL
jgi:hypothetical protein